MPPRYLMSLHDQDAGARFEILATAADLSSHGRLEYLGAGLVKFESDLADYLVLGRLRRVAGSTFRILYCVETERIAYNGVTTDELDELLEAWRGNIA